MHFMIMVDKKPVNGHASELLSIIMVLMWEQLWPLWPLCSAFYTVNPLTRTVVILVHCTSTTYLDYEKKIEVEAHAAVLKLLYAMLRRTCA